MKHVVYWISRALRILENPALIAAQQEALQRQEPLVLFFNLYPDFPHANSRNMDFLLKGLAEVSEKLHALNIPTIFMEGDALINLQKLHDQLDISLLITEHNPLRPVKTTHQKVGEWATSRSVRFIRVNTACVIPVWDASPKLEFSAKTIRNKLMSRYDAFLAPSTPVVSHPYRALVDSVFTTADAQNALRNRSWPQLSLSKLIPGEEAANQVLEDFIRTKLDAYDRRNEIDSQGQSHLSAYLHYGMISPVKMIRDVKNTNHRNAALFIEEAMVRRELAENYVHYCENYDNFKGAWPWAQASLNAHREDPRPYLYTLSQFEQAQTHDALWNACQTMVLETGYLHSYLRMYWAKMVLLWSESPEEAIRILIHLNDTYFLDGRDPNGYTGIMWSVCAVHDRPWFDKPIHGLIRAMGKDGTLKKTKIRL